MNLKQKLLLSIITTSTLVLLVFSFFIYRRSAETIKQNYINSVSASLDVCAATFDDLMQEAYFAAVDAANTVELVELVEQQDSTGIQEFLEKYLTGNVDSIYCWLDNQDQLVRVTPHGTLTELCTADQITWIQHTAENIRNPLRPISTTDGLGTIRKQIFLYNQPIVSADTGRRIGYIIATVDERIVYFKCLQSSQAGLNGEAYITTADGKYASCSDLNKLGKPEADVADNELKTSVQASLSRYSFHSVVNQDVITKDIQHEQRRIICLALLLIVLACVPVWILVRNMIKPLQQLEEAMERVGQGDLSARAAIYHQDEIGRLSMDFNSMVKELDSVIGELVTQKMLKKEAEIEALQYQIQPHFIYNTLNSIKYAAVLQNAKGIAELLEAFIELMQLTASDRGAFIPLEREMHMVENYVKLQQFRYANSFMVQYDIMQDTKKCYVPALLIQPLIENAILHGIDLKKDGGLIQVSAMRLSDTLMIRVQDNGRGLSNEAWEQLMSGKQRSKFSGIGVGNIRERLALYYGGRAELRMYSQNGTTALITLPISYDENEYTI